MGTAIIGLIGVIVGAGVSTGVTYLLAVRKEAAETRNWRRDRCLEAYTDVLKACATIRSEAIAAYVAECNTEEHIKHARLIAAAIAELEVLVDRVLLFSPKEMYDDLKNLTGYCFGTLGKESIKCPKITSTEWDAIQGARYTDVFGDFIAAARNDLGIHKPHFTAKEWLRRTEEWKRNKAS
jgi:hypothetical protein